jgi:TonB family protein
MRKTTFVNTLYFCVSLFCFVALAMICRPAFAQDATPAAAPAKEAPASAVPSDPKVLMLVAARINDLTGDAVKPWHLKATWQMLDEKGGITEQGIYEEFWVSPTKYKSTYTGMAFTKTEFGTEKGPLFTGPEDTPPYNVAGIHYQFVSPMMSSQAIEQASFDLQRRKLGDINLACLCMKDVKGYTYGTTWCLDADKPVVRVVVPKQGARIAHTRILSFQGRYIAGDLQFVKDGNLVLTAHLDSIEALATIDEALFKPPPDAAPLKLRLVPVSDLTPVSATVMAGMIVYKVPPEYPPTAKQGRITGTVVLQATIGKDGKMKDLHVISGPILLQQAALDAVRQWVYRPYLLMGEPVEVLTTVNIIFTLGNN